MMLIARRIPAAAKISDLCSENHTSCGNAPKSDTKVAPAPSVIKSAGSAQQISVLAERNRVILGNNFSDLIV
jgi:hypothetical protein